MVKKFPSQIKYEENNPAITFRMKKNEKQKIKQMAGKARKSISELVRIALLDLERDFSDVVADIETRKYVEGMNDWAIWFLCNICGYSIYIKPNSKKHNDFIDYIKKEKQSWVHTECNKKKNSKNKMIFYKI